MPDSVLDDGPFYHGTKAGLKIGDLLTPGYRSNYRPEIVMNHIYFTALADGAGLAAALAPGDGEERVYIVEPTGEFENARTSPTRNFPAIPRDPTEAQRPCGSSASLRIGRD